MAEKEHRPGCDPGRRGELDGGSLSGQYTTGTDIVAVTRWARTHLAVDNIPTFGSTDWCQLPDVHPAKLASAVRAAVAWATETAMLPALLAQQLADDDALVCQRLKGMAGDLSAATDWRAEAQRISRHAQFEAQHPWAKRVAS